MKRFHSLTLILACGLAVCASPLIAAPSSAAQQSTPPQAQQEQPQSQPSQQQQAQQRQQAEQQQQAQQQGQVFRGTMVMKAGKYFFNDASSKTTYQLDHQAQLSKYKLDGKKVQIVGTVDTSNRMIHVTRIALLHTGNASQ